jgi:serine protease AprX
MQGHHAEIIPMGHTEHCPFCRSPEDQKGPLRGRQLDLSRNRLVGAASGTALLLAAAATLTAPPTTPAVTQKIVAVVSELEPTSEIVERTVHRLGGVVLEHLSVVDGFTARLPRSALPALATSPGVRWAVPNSAVRLQAQYGQDSGVASAVYTDVVRASKTWAFGTTGQGVGVAVVDTGVDTSGDLAGQVVHAEDFTAEQNNADTYGHGTFVAGLIAGSGAASNGAVRGVAPGASLVSLKIAEADGGTDVTRVLESLEWILDFRADYNIRVVNLSLGFTTTQSAVIDPLDFAVERVWNAGLVVVTAAGNGGRDTPSITAPGNDPLVITVGAENDRTTVGLSDDNVASFSSSGPTVDGWAKPDLIAPGRSVVSSRAPGSTIDVANPNSAIDATYGKGSGTSFATAVVSGVAALVLSRHPLLNPNQVKQRLVSSARTPANLVGAAAGRGVVDAFGASMSSDLTEANVGVVPALGGGSLQATRGPACLRDTTTGGCLSDADADALLGFDAGEYFTDTWAGSQWVGSQWVGSQWVGSQWVGSQWVGSQWVGSQWVGSTWLSVGGP